LPFFAFLCFFFAFFFTLFFILQFLLKNKIFTIHRMVFQFINPIEKLFKKTTKTMKQKIDPPSKPVTPPSLGKSINPAPQNTTRKIRQRHHSLRRRAILQSYAKKIQNENDQ